MIGIYKITNKVNGKVYIGQSINIKERWHRHKTDYNKIDNYLYRAFKKYGLDNFLFEIIEECEKEDLNNREIYWIKYYDSHNPQKGYNLTSGGDSPTFTILTEKQVLEIFELLRQPITMLEIAKRYNVHHTTISNINLGKTWYHKNISYPIRKTNEYNKTKMTDKNNEYFCIDCGKKISYKATRCLDCDHIHQRKVNRISRQQLKILIRKEPFSKIGKQFGVSDNAIRRWCDSYNLPRTKKEINSYSDEEWKLI